MKQYDLAIVYSALHTGTWFACEILLRSSLEETDVREDAWARAITGDIIEHLNPISKRSINLLIDQGKPPDPHVELVILQAHHRVTSRLEQNLLIAKPEIPVVVPFRDPFLALNTRAWRETGSMKALQEETEEYREYRVRDLFGSILRLLEIPKEHIFLFPIDTERTDVEKIALFRDVLSHCNMTPNEELVERALAWKPVNPTVDGNFAQQKLHEIEENEFVITKQAMLTNDIAAIEKYLAMELELTREILGPHKQRLQDLGYKGLSWW